MVIKMFLAEYFSTLNALAASWLYSYQEVAIHLFVKLVMGLKKVLLVPSCLK